MIEQDTIRLLRECDAGIKMGVDSIEDVLEHVKSPKFCKLLQECAQNHNQLDSELQQLLEKYQDEGKDPNPIAKGMSWVKSEVMMGLKDCDATAADLITDGCNMGVKSLNKYLNKYQAADETSKDLCKRLIRLEEKLAVDIREFL